jgi:hypothetical protein
VEVAVPNARLSVRIAPAIRQQLSKEASRINKSESDIVREALEEFLSKLRSPSTKRSCYDVASELGVIGAVKDAPQDLSTNRRYFRRFAKGK